MNVKMYNNTSLEGGKKKSYSRISSSSIDKLACSSKVCVDVPRQKIFLSC